MNERHNKAVEILTRVRSCYLDRLTDLVLENEEELMDQAKGEISFANTEGLVEISEKLRQLLVISECYKSSLADQEPQTEIATQPQITFELWETHVSRREWEQATGCLAILFQINVPTAMNCMEFFADRLMKGFNMKPLIDELRGTVKTNPARTIILLRECFGLRGEIAVYVFNCLYESGA